MSTKEKLRKKLLAGKSDKNFDFTELCTCVQHLGFSMRRGRGDHAVFDKEGVPEIITLQPSRDGKAKPYQVRLIRAIVEKYRL
jgi:hypothetical protein